MARFSILANKYIEDRGAPPTPRAKKASSVAEATQALLAALQAEEERLRAEEEESANRAARRALELAAQAAQVEERQREAAAHPTDPALLNFAVDVVRDRFGTIRALVLNIGGREKIKVNVERNPAGKIRALHRTVELST